MTNLHNDQKNNLVSFLRRNQPLPQDAHPDLEQRLIDSLEPRAKSRSLYFAKLRTALLSGANRRRIPAKLLATGFLFTSVSLNLRTPRIALEPKDLENFLVKNWHNTLGSSSYTATNETEAYWLLPTSESPGALSFSAR